MLLNMYAPPHLCSAKYKGNSGVMKYFQYSDTFKSILESAYL